MRRALIAALAACGGGTPPAAIEGHAALPAARATPAPSITWIDNGFETPGLPAVARDGSIVVLAIHAEDGGRGAPNLTLVVKDRHDTAIATVPVLGVDEAEAMFDEHGVTPALRARIQAANERLAALHGRHDLVPLPAFTVDRWRVVHGEQEALPAEERLAASGDDLSVVWKAGRLTIDDRAHQLVNVATPGSWVVQDRPMCTTCTETCHNAAFLGAVEGDARRRLVVLTISYTGTDTCWEPSSQHHVVAW